VLICENKIYFIISNNKMAYIPTDSFLNSKDALTVLENIDMVQHIVPRQDPSSFIPNDEKAKLSFYNKQQIDKDITESNFNEEIGRYMRAKDLYKMLPEVREKYRKYEGVTNMNNRFMNTSKKSIEGVGVDASGDHPKNWTQEKTALNVIENAAEKAGKWPGSTDKAEEEMYRQSIGNIIFWQSSNWGQLVIGTPVQVASAVIQLTSLAYYDPSAGSVGTYKFVNSVSGSELLKMRMECDGLKYILEGNKVDMQEKGFDGVKFFMNRTFNRFFYARGTGTQIQLKVTGSNTTFQISTSDPSSGKSVVMFDDPVKEALHNLHDPSSKGYYQNVDDESKKNRFCAILVIYAMFFMYVAYIHDLYENLIDKISNKELKDRYLKAKWDTVGSYVNLLNFAVHKKFGFKSTIDVKDLIVVGVKDLDKLGGIGAGLLDGGKDYYDIKYNLKEVLDNIKTDKITTSKIYFGFKDSKLYERIFDEMGLIDNEAFSPDNYPIVFSDIAPGTPTKEKAIDYRRTIERLTNFLLMDKGGVPKLGSELIAVGAPYQNEVLLRNTAKAIGGYYAYVSRSKAIYLGYMDLKLNIFSSGVPAKEVIELRDYLMNMFSMIATRVGSPVQKNLECLKLVGYVIEDYRKLRQEELRLTDEKYIYDGGVRRVLGENPKDYMAQFFRSVKKVKLGVQAVIRMEVAKLTYKLFKLRNPGLEVCGNYEKELLARQVDVDKSMEEELGQIFGRMKANLELKYGSNSLRDYEKAAKLITISTLPRAPATYVSAVGQMFSLAGKQVSFSKGVLSRNSGGELPIEFAEYLQTCFKGMTIFLPAVILTNDTVFNDERFFLIDVFRSALAGGLVTVNLMPYSPEVVYKRVQSRGYIMISAETHDMDDPSKWRVVDFRRSMKRLVDEEGRFGNLVRARHFLFDILANDKFLGDLMTTAIPEKSKTSLFMRAYCEDFLRKTYSQCNLLISRDQFGSTVQGDMSTLPMTRGIDMESGDSYVNPFGGLRLTEGDIVRR